MNIEQIFDRYRDQLMALPGVIGLGIGEQQGQPVVIVMVDQLSETLRVSIPASLEGVPVVIQRGGEITAL